MDNEKKTPRPLSPVSRRAFLMTSSAVVTTAAVAASCGGGGGYGDLCYCDGCGKSYTEFCGSYCDYFDYCDGCLC
jgi:hypothetical protein